MKNQIAVLGAGMIGSAIATDLAGDFFVTSIDIDEKKLKYLKGKLKIDTSVCDISDSKALKNRIKEFDFIISAVPGFMGFNTLKSVIEAGKDVVDISFFEEDPFDLDNFAKSKNVTALIDCGVAPGLSNIILGRHNAAMKIDSFECFVGGLPFKKTFPFQYKVPFSPSDVIEEYIRPARMVENGKQVIKPALSEPELLNIDPIGILEAFNTDGLRTLLQTMRIPNMKEKTLRYPGHITQIQFLKDAGFFEGKEISVGDKKIKPIEYTSQILLPQWKLEPNEHEFTVMIIKIEGIENGIHKTVAYKLFDKFDEIRNITSMARTTGYTCSSVARRILNNDYARKGISPPEYLGADEKCYSKILAELKNRGIVINRDEQ